MRIKSIAFFFPYYEVSGVPVLFSNIAKTLSRTSSYRIYIVDYVEGYMSRILRGHKYIELIPFTTGEKCLIETDVLILQSILPFGTRPELTISKKTKIIFWNLHPNNLIPNVYPWAIFSKPRPELYKFLVTTFWQKRFRLMRSFIKTFSDQGSLMFMDSTNLKNTESFYSLSLGKTKYLPIACDDGSFNKSSYNIQNGVINFGWIGRLCDFKIHILNYLIKCLNKLSVELKTNILLHIIGDGPEKINLYSPAKSNKLFKIRRIGRISKDKMNTYLKQNIQINASMGTSVLESAKYGIPSIVLDYDFIPIKGDYCFRWLHNTRNYDLGHPITNMDYLKDNSSLKEMILDFKINSEELSKKSYDYYFLNHSLEMISKKILTQVQEAKLSIEDIDSTLIKKGKVRTIYENIKYKKNMI